MNESDIRAHAVRDQLVRILADPQFARSPRLSRFLTFLVEEKLSSRSHELKEYTVGLLVFDKPASFDPKSDSSVRTEAVKLRAKLTRYYEAQGRDDPVIITVPKGSYIAEFQHRETLPSSQIDPPFSPPVRKPRRRMALFIAALLGFLFPAALLINSTRPESPAKARVVPLTTYPGHEYGGRFSPDGSQFVFMWDGEHSDNMDIYVRLVEAEPPLRLTSDPAKDWVPAWSPDGNWIAFIREPWGRGEVRLIRPLGGPERLVGRSRGGAWLAWSPDSKLLAMADRVTDRSPLAIVLIEIATGKRRQLTFPPISGNGDANFSFAPDGKKMAFIREDHGQDLYVVDVRGGEPRRLTKGLGLLYGVDWMPDGRSLVFSRLDDREAHLWELPLTRLLLQPQPRRMQSVKVQAEYPNVFRGVRGRSPKVIFESSDDDVDLWTTDIGPGHIAESPRRFPANSTQADENPQYSPDGRRIVFASSRSGSAELWLCLADGSQLQQLTHLSTALLGCPRWAPDGKKIAFDSFEGTEGQVLTIDVDTRQVQQLTAGHEGEVRPSWSADGNWIYFRTARSGREEIWKRPSAGGEPTQVTLNGGSEIFESSEMGQIFYCKRWDKMGLWRMPVGGGPETLVHPLVGQGWWEGAKSGIYFLENIPNTSDSALRKIRFPNYDIVQLAIIRGPLPLHTPILAVSPDETQLTYAKFEHLRKGLMMLDYLP